MFRLVISLLGISAGASSGGGQSGVVLAEHGSVCPLFLLTNFRHVGMSVSMNSICLTSEAVRGSHGLLSLAGRTDTSNA